MTQTASSNVERKSVHRMSIKEFRELGFLQEVNRRFFHPLGLALEVAIDGRTGEEYLNGIWDYRSDPVGIVFTNLGEYAVDVIEKAAVVKALADRKSKERFERFGWVIQPLPSTEPDTDDNTLSTLDHD